MATFKPFLLLISLLSLILISSSFPLRGLSKGDYIPCALYLNVKTLSDPNAGTTSNVSITLTGWRGRPVTIRNLVDWNRKPPPRPDYVYFQSGNLDNLSGEVYCNPSLFRRFCSITITITGTGSSPTWGCDYIDVVSPVLGCATFHVQQWLTPKNNYSVSVSHPCPRSSKGMTGCTKGSLAI